MAIKMSAAELETFKRNVDQLLPYHDHRLLDRLSKSLYQSSNYHYEVVQGLESSIAINQIQLYSHHNLENECRLLCRGILLPDFYDYGGAGQRYLDKVEYQLYPKREALRLEQRAQRQEQCNKNAAMLKELSARPAPQRVDTSSFPDFAQSLNIYCATDAAFAQRQSPVTITIYGVAAGHLIEYIHKRHPEVEINVVILNPTVTAIMLCLDPNMGARLASAHTHLYWGTDKTPVLPNSIVLPAEVHLAPELNSNLKQRLILSNEHNYSKLLAAKRNRNLHSVLAAYNFVYDKIAKQLCTDTFNRCEAIALILSGPSLLEKFPRIKELQEMGVRLIACDSALPALEQVPIVPDIVVVSDVGLYLYAGKRIQGSPVSAQAPRFLTNPKIYQKSALIFNSKTHLLIPALFPGQKYIIYTKDLERRNVPKEPNALTNLDLGLSSSSVMLDLALSQGAQKIFLFGFDTVSRNDTFHAGFSEEFDEAIISHEESDYVPCVDGHMRRALHCYTRARIHFEKKIMANKGVSIINCSSYGAIIKGTLLETETKTINIHSEAFVTINGPRARNASLTATADADAAADAAAKTAESAAADESKSKGKGKSKGKSTTSTTTTSTSSTAAATNATTTAAEAKGSKLTQSALGAAISNLALHSSKSWEKAQLSALRAARACEEAQKRSAGTEATTNEALAIAQEAAAAIQALVGTNPEDEGKKRRKKSSTKESGNNRKRRRKKGESLLMAAEAELFDHVFDESESAESEDEDEYYTSADDEASGIVRYNRESEDDEDDYGEDDYGDGNSE